VTDDGAPKPKKRLPVRWLTLAEIVGVAAVVIAGLGYWDNHRERMQESRERAQAERERQAEARAGALRLTFLMTGAPSESGDRIRLTPTHPEHVIQTQTLIFPTEVRGDPVETTGNPRIERGWFAKGLAKAVRERRDGSDAHEGRLPVGIVTTYVDAGVIRTDSAIYQIGYRAEDRLLRGDKVELEGLSLARRASSANLQAAVDGLWSSSAPPPKP
jgi:hypothetical protein